MYRALDARAADDWRALAESRLHGDPRLVHTEEVADVPAGWAAFLRHERLPFVSYPYEWPFSFLKRAALLQLDLLRDAVEAGFMLKDGTPFNVQFRGAESVFIDLGSFTRLREGEPWPGYRQFCCQQLYPLLLQSWLGLDFQPWLRGSLEGLTPEEMRRLLRLRDRFRRGATTHVVLHARLERRYGGRGREVRSELRRAGFSKELVIANARSLGRLVQRLDWHPEPGTWSSYRATSTYGRDDEEAKGNFVRGAVAEVRPNLVWDLGCNDGTYARIAAEEGAYVVAVDGDHAVVDGLARELAAEDNTSILPLVVDLGDPSPARGWRGAERRTLEARGRPELVLALALVHHLAIGRNIPLAELCDWLADLGAVTVVEWVEPHDPMAQRLLEVKDSWLHEDYTRAVWERLLRERFEVARTQERADGLRVLYRLHPLS